MILLGCREGENNIGMVLVLIFLYQTISSNYESCLLKVYVSKTTKKQSLGVTFLLLLPLLTREEIEANSRKILCVFFRCLLY